MPRALRMVSRLRRSAPKPVLSGWLASQSKGSTRTVWVVIISKVINLLGRCAANTGPHISHRQPRSLFRAAGHWNLTIFHCRISLQMQQSNHHSLNVAGLYCVHVVAMTIGRARNAS